MLKSKAVDGLSIGYKSSSKLPGGKLTDVDLMEISVVTFPACEDAKVESVKSDDQEKTVKQSETDKQIDSFAEIVKAVSRLTQTIYALLK